MFWCKLLGESLMAFDNNGCSFERRLLWSDSEFKREFCVKSTLRVRPPPLEPALFLPPPLIVGASYGHGVA
jgi:hypothetical protein